MGNYTKRIVKQQVEPDLLVSAFFKKIHDDFDAHSFVLEHEHRIVAGMLCPVTEQDLASAMAWLEDRVGGAQGSNLMQIHFPDIGMAGLVMVRGVESPQGIADALKKYPVQVHTNDGKTLTISSDGRN